MTKNHNLQSSTDQQFSVPNVACRLAGLLLATAVTSVHAGGNLSRIDPGSSEIELEWQHIGPRHNGWEIAAKYGLNETMEIELSATTAHDQSEFPTEKSRGIGLEWQWWPIEFGENWSAGASLGLERVRESTGDGEKSVANERETTLLLKWAPESYALKWELGYAHERSGDERESRWTGAVAAGIELTEMAELEVKLSKAQSERLSIEASLSIELTEEIELALTIGRQSQTNMGAIGIEYSF